MSSAADLEFLPAVRKTDAEERIRLLDSIRPRICEEYTKEIPHPTQQLFLLQNAQEVMFGGAAGGGKSSALLMSALQYADVPGYSALLLRRTWPDLSLPGAIMDRAGQWLRDTDASPREGGRTWVFPSGARITFGYLQYDKDKWRYQSAEFQFIGFDELTQFQQSTYEYMFSRLRRPNLVCIRCQRSVTREDRQWVHSVSTQCTNVTPDPKMLARYTPSPDGKTLFDVPLRVRSATNPGGVGHGWVRDRFIDPELRLPGAIFIPSTLADNPSLDAETYRENLAHLNPIDRERLMNGDWDVMEEGDFFQRHWFKFIREVPADTRIRWVRYWDVAATAEGDWTAGCLIGLTPDGEWIVADMRRMRGTPREVERFIHQTAVEDGVRVPIRMEQEPGSSGVMAIDHYRRNILVGYDFRPDKKTNDKQTRANPVSSAAEAGNISLLVGRWNRDFLDEVALFPHGANDDQCLSGDTILHTPDGPKPITEISAGDTVLGQTGWTRVLAAKMTSPAGVTTERFGIRATADHPVWTTRGWTPFLDVLDDDTLSTCCVSQTGVAVRQQRAGSVCAATNGSGVSAKGSNPNPSTPRVRSRVVPMGASTSRATAQSTTSVTESTATHCMSRGQSVGQSGWKPWSSTGSPSGDIQILPTRRTGDISSPVVSGLGKVSKPCTRKSGNSITEISQRGTTSITRMGISPTTPSTIWNAWSLRITGLSTPRTGRNALAHQNNWPTLTESGHLPLRGTGRQKVGSGTVNMQPSSARVEPVYNITTEDHTYYANGVLVHNCDALTGGFASLTSRRARLLA